MRFSALFLISGLSLALAQTPIQVRVDATDAPRRVFHVTLNIAAKPGPMTLLYPQWIPGDHMPDGPIPNLVGLVVKANGNIIPWRRDSVNMFAFHLDVPAGASSLDVAFDFLSPGESGGGEFLAGSSTTTELSVLNWNQFVLYPQDSDPDKLQFQAHLRLPSAWKYGTALPIARESGGDIDFAPASLTTLIDSPISAGSHYRTVDLGVDGGIHHYLHLAGDSDRAVDMSPELVNDYKNLVAETGALFGARHYRDYHFLYTLSDHIAHFGLEHHESSDDRLNERTIIDPSLRTASAYLLCHEFVHSWNGKYRRPAGLTSGGHDGGYDTPMKGDLLWVYEGLTNYLGEILTPRSGLWTAAEYRESIAGPAADMDNTYGRRWRPLEDTAVGAQLLYGAPEDYSNYRRSVDYYPEGSLIWLEVDVMIRQMSKGAKSLDDFCHAFHGGSSGEPIMKTYDFADVVAALNAVQPYDWAGYFNQRLNMTSEHAPLGGIEGSGWKLAYDNVRSDFWKSDEDRRKIADLSYSIGLKIQEDDSIVADVQYGGPARIAGVTPGVKMIAVNGRQYTSTVLREAIDDAVKSTKPIELLFKNGEYYETKHVDYHGGQRYPHLVRDESKPDLLSQITAAHKK